MVFFDALRVKIRNGGGIKNMAVHLALGVDRDGRRDVLGMWVAENEGAAFWANVFSGLKNRGVEDILIAVTDGLKGMTTALESVFPQTLHQTCIVHLIRSSTTFVSYKDRKTVCEQLKPIYQAVDAEAAERALETFETSAMGSATPPLPRPGAGSGHRWCRFFSSPPKSASSSTRPTRSKGSTEPFARSSRRGRCFPTKQPPRS